MAKKDFVMRLSFSTRGCSCGGTRLAAHPCPECGAKPRQGEVDIPLQRRQRIRSAFLDKRVSVEPCESDFFDLLERAGQVVDPFLKALAALAAADREDLVAILSAGRVVDQLLADSSLTQPRPWTRPGRLLHEGVAQLSAGLYRFVDAMAASTLLDAQRIQAEAQAELDAAALSAAALGRSVSDLSSLFDLSSETFVQALATRVQDMVEAVSTGGSLSLLDVDRALVARVHQLVGDEPVADGVGLGVLWATALAEVIFDYDEFVSTASGIYALLRASGGFDGLHRTTAWQENQARARRSMMGASTALDAMLAAARHDTAEVRGMLLFAQDLIEGAGKHCLATLLAVTGGRSYGSLMAYDAGRLLNNARQQARLTHLVDGVDPAFRRASAHLDFEVREQTVVLQPGPHEQILDATQFFDRLLHLTESLHAVSTAIEVRILQAGGTLDLAGLELLATEDLVKLVLVSAGLEGVEVRIDGDTLLANAAGVLDDALSIVAAFMPIMPTQLQGVHMTWGTPGRTRTLVVPLNIMRPYLSAPEDSFEKTLRFWELTSAALLDDHPILRREGLRKLAALSAAESVGLPITELIKRVRSIRETVTRIGDEDCAEVLRSFIRFLRHRAMGEDHDPEDLGALRRIDTWGKARIKEPFRN
jgi:hypothetical protein